MDGAQAVRGYVYAFLFLASFAAMVRTDSFVVAICASVSAAYFLIQLIREGR